MDSYRAMKQLRIAAAALLLLAACKDRKPANDKVAAPATPDAAAETAPADAAPTNVTPPDAASAPASAVPASDEQAAELIYAAAGDPAKADAAAALVPAGNQVKLIERGGGSGKKSFEGVAGLREAFQAGNATSMKLAACKNGCCELKPAFDDERRLGMQLRKVCFDDKRALTSLEIAYEN